MIDMDNISIGTASWTDKSLIDSGLFYPREATTAEARLRYYASVFHFVEVDSSYYAMPSASNSALWAERTPPGFTFNVKAFRLFTGHKTSPTALHKDLRELLPAGTDGLYYKSTPAEIKDELWRRFREALAPLRQAGKLVAVHFQFAPWVIRNPAGHAHVAECIERMGGHLVSVEFRNKTWFEPDHRAATMAFERELGVAHVVVDEPQGFANSIPQVWDVASPGLVVLRLHGRNKATWNIKGATAASDRFNYDYPDAQLREFVPNLRALAARVKRLQVVFNNNMEDQAQRNARTLKAMLKDGCAVREQSHENVAAHIGGEPS